MAEPTNAELRTEILASLAADASSRERRDALLLERIGRIAGDVEGLRKKDGEHEVRLRSIAENHAALTTRMERFERTRAPFDDAMKSQHDIDMGFREDLRRIEATVMARLDRQDEGAAAAALEAKNDAEAREAKKTESAELRAVADAEARRQESLAVRKLAADRDEAGKRRDFWLKVVVAFFGFVTSVATIGGAVYVQMRTRDDTSSQLREFRRTWPATAPAATFDPSPAPAMAAPPTAPPASK